MGRGQAEWTRRTLRKPAFPNHDDPQDSNDDENAVRNRLREKAVSEETSIHSYIGAGDDRGEGEVEPAETGIARDADHNQDRQER
jgi:hypothetical protein